MNKNGVKNVDALLLTIAVILICVGIVILGVYAYVLFQWSWPQIIDNFGQAMSVLPLLAMTTGKHDFKTEDLVIALVVVILVLILGFFSLQYDDTCVAEREKIK